MAQRRNIGRKRHRAASRFGQRRALRLEPLEDRRLLASFTVDTVLDTIDESDGVTSLREAIQAANTTDGADAIDFAPALTAAGPATIVLSKDALTITDSLTMNGPGANLLAIDASGNDPTPDVNNADGSQVLIVDDGVPESLSEVTITNLSFSGGDAYNFGAILSTERLNLVRVAVTHNATLFGVGGIYNHRGVLTIVASDVSDNHTYAETRSHASGVFSEGELFITGSAITKNTGRYSGGGGIAVLAVNTTVKIENSTISGNSGPVTISTFEDGTAEINHCTITDNGPFGITFFRGSLTIDHSIVSGHSFSDLRTQNLPPPVVRHSLIGKNQGSRLTEAPLGSPDANGNLIGGPINGVIDPRLGPLTHNGGPTLTHALLQGSPALDAGDPLAVAGMGGVPLYDQRGASWSRVANGDDISEAPLDIGAFEWQTNPLPGDYNFNGIVDAADSIVWRKTQSSTTDLRADGDGDGDVDADDYNLWRANFGSALPRTFVVDTLADENDGDYSPGDFSLREAVDRANMYRSHDTIEFAPGLTATGAATIVLTQGELAISDALTVNGPGAMLLTIDASGNDPTPTLNNGDGSRIFVDANRAGLSISGLTLTGGDSAEAGGAIYAAGNFSLRDSVIAGNAAQGFPRSGSGGAIHLHVQSGETAMIQNNIIADNVGLYLGGGLDIFVRGSGVVELHGNKIEGNKTSMWGGGLAAESLGGGRIRLVSNMILDNYAADKGGGIYTKISITPTSLIEIRDTTIAGNRSGSVGGGIAATVTGGGKLKLVNSTLSGNIAQGKGGGLYATSTGNVEIRYSTIVGNRAAIGGGIHNDFGVVTLTSSIVANSVAPTSSPDWRTGSAQITVMRNLIGDNSGTGLAATPSGTTDNNDNRIGSHDQPIDPRLAPLAENGGTEFLDGSGTLTHAPLNGSVVIDGSGLAQAGVGEVPQFDGRGAPFVRVAGGNSGPRIDIGAFELQPDQPDEQADSVVADAVLFAPTQGAPRIEMASRGSAASINGLLPAENATTDDALVAWLSSIDAPQTERYTIDSVSSEATSSQASQTWESLDIVFAQL